jgi:asparagine synthase (glutamine-hydrolysing)
MAFIYGIIDFDNKKRNAFDIDYLGNAVSWENFQSKSIYQKDGIYLGTSWLKNDSLHECTLETDEYIVIYEGLIFNHDSVSQLIDYTSDASCFLAAYLKWGVECANKINGQFSVVIVHKKTKKVDFFRDHIGASSLSYYFNNKTFIFSTHAFGIAKSKLVKYTYNELYLLHRRLKLKASYEFTYFNEISKVTPGYHYTLENLTIEKHNYWKPEKINRNRSITRKEAVKNLNTLLIKAVKNRMIDDTMGLHVSGGLDCTGVASIVAQLNQKKQQLHGYSWTPDHLNEIDPILDIKGDNEKEFIEAFSKESGVPIYYVDETNENFRNRELNPEFEHMHIEQPTMKLAETHGIKLIFSGWGGDEFLSLSNRGVTSHLFFNLRWYSLIRYMYLNSIKSVLSSLYKDSLSQLNPFIKRKKWNMMKTDLQYLDSGFISKHKEYIKKNIFVSIYGKRGRNQFILNLLYNGHIPNRMDSWTYFGAKHGYRYTYPLLDKEVLDYWFSLPIEFTYDLKFARSLYREIMEGFLIDAIRLRNDKNENLRIQHSYNQKKEAFPFYLSELKKTISSNVVGFENVDLILKTADINTEKQVMPTLTKTNRFMNYLKEYNLYKKYF